MLLLVSFAVLLVTAVLSFVFYNQFAAQIRYDLRSQAQLFANDDQESALQELGSYLPGDLRFTLVLPGGQVAFDNYASATEMEPHLSREEIQEAFQTGVGESRRFSDTLETEIYYYALRLTDGSVLRVAKTSGSIWRLYSKSLPLVSLAAFITVLLAYFLAGRQTRRVVAPIRNLAFGQGETALYDEFAPFVHTLESHRRELAKSHAELEGHSSTISALMDNMQEGVVLLDQRGQVLSLNKTAAAIFGPGDRSETQSVFALLRDADFIDRIQKALAGERGEMSLERSGRLFRIFISPVANMGIVVLFLDVTESAQAEKIRREFSANVSHELKTPLTSIYGTAEMLCENLVQETDKPGFYRRIVQETSRLIALVEDIIMLSELDEGKVEQTKEPVNLAAVARECAESLLDKAAEFEVSFLISGNGTVLTSRSMMYELFFNLLDNGVKYNRPGGSVSVSIAEQQGQVKATVTDTGIGISPEDRVRIFERFYRVDRSRSKKSGGTGLGLAIVKHIILSQGGKITVDSRLGEGTVFTLQFDAAPI